VNKKRRDDGDHRGGDPETPSLFHVAVGSGEWGVSLPGDGIKRLIDTIYQPSAPYHPSFDAEKSSGEKIGGEDREKLN
jgi:hypothetical protein